MGAFLMLFVVVAVLVGIAAVLYILSWFVQLLAFVWRLFVRFAEAADGAIGWLLGLYQTRRAVRKSKEALL